MDPWDEGQEPAIPEEFYAEYPLKVLHIAKVMFVAALSLVIFMQLLLSIPRGIQRAWGRKIKRVSKALDTLVPQPLWYITGMLYGILFTSLCFMAMSHYMENYNSPDYLQITRSNWYLIFAKNVPYGREQGGATFTHWLFLDIRWFTLSLMLGAAIGSLGDIEVRAHRFYWYHWRGSRCEKVALWIGRQLGFV